MSQTYFMPETVTVTAPRARWKREITPQYARLVARHEQGVDVTIGGITYKGGRWSPALTSAEVAAITAAGLASRLRTVASPSLLPGDIDIP